MGFAATVHCTVLRELTTPSANGIQTNAERQNVSGFYDGSVSTHAGIVNIRYREPDGEECTVSFSKEEPDTVTLHRSFLGGEAPLNLVVEEGQRHICVNRVLGENIEITTVGKKVANTVRKDGKLRLSYCVELHGFRVEKVSLHYEIRKADASALS